MNSKQMTALFMAVMVVFLTACGSKPGYSEPDESPGRDAYMDGNTYAGGDAYYEEEPGTAPSPESEWGPVDVEPDMPAVQPDWDTSEPVPDEIHIRVEGDTIYFSGTGTVRAEDYGSYSPIVNVVMEEGITEIGNGMFRYCDDLRSVILPESLRVIGGAAFQDCYQLSGLVLPNGIESIGAYAFSECSGLTSIVLPASLKEVGQEAFSKSGLTSVVLPDGLETIDSAAFASCDSLTSVTISGSVRHMYGGQGYGGAFQNCANLTSVTLRDGLQSIGEAAFQHSGVTSVVIPDSVEEIENRAFYECRNLTEVTFGGGLTSIHSAAFMGCSLVKIRAPYSIQELIIKSGIDLSIVEWY